MNLCYKQVITGSRVAQIALTNLHEIWDYRSDAERDCNRWLRISSFSFAFSVPQCRKQGLNELACFFPAPTAYLHGTQSPQGRQPAHDADLD